MYGAQKYGMLLLALLLFTCCRRTCATSSLLCNAPCSRQCGMLPAGACGGWLMVDAVPAPPPRTDCPVLHLLLRMLLLCCCGSRSTSRLAVAAAVRHCCCCRCLSSVCIMCSAPCVGVCSLTANPVCKLLTSNAVHILAVKTTPLAWFGSGARRTYCGVHYGAIECAVCCTTVHRLFA
jgi:hypothetical protein